MDKKINLLDPKIDRPEIPSQTAFLAGNPKKKPFKLMALVFILLMFTLTIFSFNRSSDEESTSWFYRLPIIKQIKHLVESADNKLKGEDRDRINVLVLGIGGKNHEGGLLTDTIILASIKPSEKRVAMISIPRDLAVPVENMGL